MIFGRAPLSMPIAFFRVLFKNTPFIYFPYDIRAHADEKEVLRLSTSIELKMERFCIENADGILHKGAPDELNHIEGRTLGNNIKIPKLDLSFQPYCSNEFIVPINDEKISKKDGEIHFVYIGGTGKPSKEFYQAQFNTLQDILKQKIHIHMYFSSDITFNKNQESEKEKAIKDFYKNNKRKVSSNYFHIHETKGPKEIVKEISKYDFGMFIPIFSKIAGKEPKFNTGNKISTYLEAGIPLFYRHNYEFINHLMKKYDLDFIYPENFKELPKMVRNVNKDELKRNILIAQEDFNIKNHFQRLEQFVQKVVKNKKN